MNSRLVTTAIVASSFVTCFSVMAAETLIFPGREWEQASPESQGVDAVKLKAAVDYLREAAGKEGVQRMVIVRNGRMIWRGAEADKPQGVWSITKAFTSTAHGLLIEDGKCTLDTLAKDYDPALTKHYPTVTLRHLATMTSGIDGVGGGYDFDDQHRGDQNALVEPLPPFFPPGTKYMYWDEATQHYGYTLTQIAGESLEDYLKRRILDPIGVTRLIWKVDGTGKVLNWTGGIEISAEDLARFGLLYLNRGNWDGTATDSRRVGRSGDERAGPQLDSRRLARQLTERLGPIRLSLVAQRDFARRKTALARRAVEHLRAQRLQQQRPVHHSGLADWSPSGSAWTSKRTPLPRTNTTHFCAWSARRFSTAESIVRNCSSAPSSLELGVPPRLSLFPLPRTVSVEQSSITTRLRRCPAGGQG